MCELANVKMAQFENVMKASSSSGLKAGEMKIIVVADCETEAE